MPHLDLGLLGLSAGHQRFGRAFCHTSLSVVGRMLLVQVDIIVRRWSLGHLRNSMVEYYALVKRWQDHGLSDRAVAVKEGNIYNRLPIGPQMRLAVQGHFLRLVHKFMYEGEDSNSFVDNLLHRIGITISPAVIKNTLKNPDGDRLIE